jgi:hypothetical protein
MSRKMTSGEVQGLNEVVLKRHLNRIEDPVGAAALLLACPHCVIVLLCHHTLRHPVASTGPLSK